jgi:hypothetical protein
MKHIRYPFLDLSKSRKRGQKVAIIEVALTDILSFEVLIKHNAIFDYFTNPLPCDCPPRDAEV